MNEMSAGTEQIAVAVNNVNDISRSTKEAIDLLGEETLEKVPLLQPSFQRVKEVRF